MSDSGVTSSEIFGSEASLFGNDRAGRLLKDDLGKIPVDYRAYEKVFAVGSFVREVPCLNRYSSVR